MHRTLALAAVLLFAPPALAEQDPMAQLGAKTIAYFSLEMGSPALRGQRTGGLGVLAMDLVRGSARALAHHGGSVVGVTLLYDHPWAQRLDANGEQVLDDVRIDPMRWVERGALKQLDTFQVDVMGKQHTVTVFEERLGKARVLRLYSPELTRMLYNGDRDMRLAQELLLARGGLAALKRARIRPDVLHLNESHTAFVGVMAKGDRDFDDTVVVATTHTPVEAGLERFEPGDWQKTGLADEWRGHFERNGKLDLTQAMMKVAEVTNAVSDEHTEVMKRLYPDFADKLVSVQNGVDPAYWQHPSMRSLLGRTPSRRELWAVKQPLRAALIDEVKARTGVKLSADKPIVAFTRRVTDYKDTLPMLRDHIRQIVGDRDKGGLGMQVVVAGVAHPNDGGGRGWIKEFESWARDPEMKGRFVFVPDYLGPETDLDMDRIAVQGADVWLTTPKRPPKADVGMEASGTSDRRSVLNLGIQIWSPDTGGGRDYIVPFDEETKSGNGFFIEPYEPQGLYAQLGRISKMFYGFTEKGDDTYLDLLENVRRTIPKVGIIRNVRLQVARTYLPALQGRKIARVTVAPTPDKHRFDQPLRVRADVELHDLDPHDVNVEVGFGQPGRPWQATPMKLVTSQDGKARFEGRLAPLESGEHRYVVRVAGKNSDERAIEFTEEGLDPANVQRIGLLRWARRNVKLVGLHRLKTATGQSLDELLGPHQTWEFRPDQKDHETAIRPFEPLVVKGGLPFTLLSGPQGRRGDTEMAAVKQGNEWVTVLRPATGKRWMTFLWHDRPGGRYEGRNFDLKIKGPRFKSGR